MQDLPDLFNSLNDSRQQLELLSRWPQTIKQVDKQLAQLSKELGRDKSLVDRLSGKGINLAAEYGQFEEAVNKLKAARDTAVSKVQNGDAQEALDTLESDFFAQMDDVWQHHQVIQMMSNLGRFAVEFKRNLSGFEREVKNLQRRKIDTSDLEDLIAEAKSKGEEVSAMLKNSSIDPESVMSALQELETIKQQFTARRSEISGEETQRPWQGGGQTFNSLELPAGFSGQRPTAGGSSFSPTI